MITCRQPRVETEEILNTNISIRMTQNALRPGDHEIKAVLFDLGETVLNFGRISATRLFRQGARLSYDYLKSHGQPVGSFEYYCWRNLIALRIRHLVSNVVRNDFNSSVLLRGIGIKRGIRLDGEQWRDFA